ncbi:carboxymuconolactone decarboxylase family protein [Methanobacterium paludis]|uniref:Carboxymuconolactone decarboxylase n=1 Tax=Methanobacterium paludis (strain DSM 25820 / JCM 18151 / SWAN1) TaxID=868131 RepID=F6D813_METPW|nr:carboxymuconolactone decarboxylase family protein [Methanobacterium paludis]AEG17158.1 Carboxymuconolactone decarboxylase [Methanobacterium paludis]
MLNKKVNKDLPEHYVSIRKRFKEYGEALNNLGIISKESGPIDEKTSQLVQLAASTAIRSEGAVHSHAKRALKAGATPEEVYQSLLLLTSTIGFPNVAAAVSWVDDLFEE